MKRASAFTLIELLVTIAILAIVMTIAIPNFVTFVRGNRLAAQTNDLVAAINLARSEAVKRSTQTGLCASNDGSSCTGSGDWSVGWIVFRDGGSDGSPTVAEVLRKWPARDEAVTLSGPSELQYNALGNVITADDFELYFPDCTGTGKREIIITPVGRPEAESATC